MRKFNGQHTQMLAVVGIIAVLGGIFIIQSHAAAPALSSEPENGTITAPAAIVTDSTASGGKAIKFAAASTGPVSQTLPNQVSRTLYTTTAAGTQIYKYEVRTSTTITGSKAQVFIYAPASAFASNRAKIILGGHGIGAHAGSYFEGGSGGASNKTMIALMDAGYVLVSVELDQTLANQDAMDRLARAGTYIKSIWTPNGSVAMLGFSMGGMTAATALHRKPVPDMKVAYMVAPPVDFTYFYNAGAYVAEFNQAYGSTNQSTFAAATAGYDPVRQPASAYTGLHVRIASSPEDGEIRNSALKLLNIMKPTAAEAIDIQTRGVHDSATQWESPATIVSWLNQAIAAN